MTQPVIWYALLGLIVLWYAYRSLRARSIVHYSPAQVAERLRGGQNALLLDVRTEAERKNSSIKGSIHIPLHQLRAKSGELQRYRGREIICYCRSGNRSVNAALILKKLGFTAASMRGGIVEWNYSNR